MSQVIDFEFYKKFSILLFLEGMDLQHFLNQSP